MTHLLTACNHLLYQLECVIQRIELNDFRKPSATLSNATVGQHLRHTIEFFLCLETGFEAGRVNYDKRDHDYLIENDKEMALAALVRIREFVLTHHQDKRLELEVAYERDCENWVTIETNYKRELVYNIEHAVHHMAIMKIGLREVAPYIQVPDDFGVAASTLRFQEGGAITMG